MKLPVSRQPAPKQFVSILWACFGALFIVTVAFLLYVWTEKRIDHANQQRYASRTLIEELRQSSDDLTRMARSYVVTGDPQYRRQYQEVLDIRDGRVPRPQGYDNVYWDLVVDPAKRPRQPGAAVPLIDLLRQAGFTPGELRLLTQAKYESDRLTGIENKALAMRDFGGDDPDALAAARAMLYDASYHRAKAAIMLPIAQVTESVERRTLHAVENTALQANGARLGFILFALVLVTLLWRAKRRLDATLGCSVDQLQQEILRLGRGDMSEPPPVPVPDNARDSVLAWLAESRHRLASVAQERTDALARAQRLGKLYAALSQCNQAIVRSRDEQELFASVCDAVVSHGGMSLAWVGVLDPDSLRVAPVAGAGDHIDYLNQQPISVDPALPEGRGPAAAAYRDDAPFWCQDFGQVPLSPLWRQHSERCGWRAAMSIPLHRHGAITGFFSAYSTAADAFDPEVQALFIEMASDIEFALKNFDRERQREQTDERIQYLAHFDTLTGLPNRAQLQEHTLRALDQARAQGAPLALMMLDLDHFKDINDSLGHSVGDGLLCELAKRLRQGLREGDMVARLGGDEFIFVLQGAGAQEATEAARKIMELIAQPFRVGMHDLKVTASVGIALCPDDGDDMENLLQRADAAMYQVKRAGRHDYRFFTAAMHQRAARHLQLVNLLRYAIERGQLRVVYQPQVALRGLHPQRIVGAEALLRWTTPELGDISPVEFIPAAEDSGLILPIGAWVLRQAVRQARAWLDAGLPPLVMAVNLSATQFRDTELPELVSQILLEEGLPPEYLELELTEGVALHDPQGAITMMNHLHERGIRMSIDDFGTGYSSLSHLKKFKVYKLKIDKSFVRDISTDAEDKAIVSAIINMARSLGLKTIAEGVETAEQLAFLRQQDCDEMQGFYFSKPVDAEEFRDLLADHAFHGSPRARG